MSAAQPFAGRASKPSVTAGSSVSAVDVSQFTRVLAAELAEFSVSAFAYAPGFVDTDMTDNARHSANFDPPRPVIYELEFRRRDRHKVQGWSALTYTFGVETRPIDARLANRLGLQPDGALKITEIHTSKTNACLQILAALLSALTVLILVCLLC